MAKKPSNKSTKKDKPASQSNAGQSKTEVGDINVGGSVGGNIIVGHGNIINMSPEQQVLRSLHQLPQPPADFTGREELIAQVLADFEKGRGATITGLTGMGGIGKTALGLVVAHQVAKDYPDAQIFLDLKGTTTPLSAMDIMRHVILSFEPKADLHNLDERGMSTAYRSVLYEKRALLFLDNARSAEQIAPLRPPETCALLVTSRWVFPVPGLQPQRVDVMRQEKAKEFLLSLCPRIGDKADELARACAYLPLALRIAGSFLGVNDNLPIDQCIKQLNDRKGRLAILQENREEAELKTEPDLLATFEMSYNQLSEENQKRWRILGVFPASFDVNAANAMWGLEEDATRKVLGLLLRYSLLEYDATSSHYSLHDLLGDYALTKSEEEEELTARVSHSVYYSEVLATINQMYLQGGENLLLGLRLYDAERMNIEAGQYTSALYLEERSEAAVACNQYAGQGAINRIRLKPKDRSRWIEVGLQAARILGNKEAEGAHLGSLGIAYDELGETGKAIEHHGQHLAIAREIGDRRGEGTALANLGTAYKNLGEASKGIEYLEQALVISREIGDRRGEAYRLANLGNAYLHLKDVHQAIEFSEKALVIHRETGERRGEGNVLLNLGNAYYGLGEVRKAIEYYEQALVIHREISDRYGEGFDLFNMGSALYDLEDKNRAIHLMKQALEIYEAIESPTAERARNQLKEWGAL